MEHFFGRPAFGHRAHLGAATTKEKDERISFLATYTFFRLIFGVLCCFCLVYCV